MLKRIVFYFSLFAIPFLFLAILEGGLRLLGYGESYPLWIKDGAYYHLNPRYPQLFFSRNDIAVPEFIPQKIPVKKSQNTKRIVCLGGSTTEGFPFEVNINFPHFLRCYLTRRFPDQQWQVVNLGLSAINSHSVRFMLPEILDIKPDAVLVYMGHNEFYGALGLASSQALGSNPTVIQWFLHLKRLRLYQLMASAIHSILPHKTGTPKTLMAAMIKRNSLSPGDPIYQKTIRNFRLNLSSIVSFFRQNRVPVYVSTLTSNLKDQEPLSYPDPKESIAGYAQILSEMEKGHWESACTLLKSALKTDNKNALAYYLLGRCYYRLKNFAQAKRAFVAARDWDRLPFRAPSALNEIIRAIGSQPGVFLVPTDSLFCAHAPHGIPDSTLFLEHLHPNAHGYQLLAYGFFNRLERNRARKGALSHSLPSHCQNFTRLDEAIGALKIADLVSKPPFSGRTHFALPVFSPGEILEIAREHVYGTLLWDAAHLKMGSHFVRHNDWQRALKEYFAVLEADSQHVSALYHIGDIYVQIDSAEKALSFYRKGVAHNPNLAFVRAKLARALLLTGNVSEALDVIKFLLTNTKMRRQFSEAQLEGLKQLELVAQSKLQM